MGLLSLAIVLLLLINIATFVMVQRMSENNATNLAQDFSNCGNRLICAVLAGCFS